MQVSVETTKGLERKLTVQLPQDKFDEAVEAKIKSLSRTVKMSGFRPGKVPLKIVRQQYGADVQQEVLNDMVRSGYSEAIIKEKLNPAGYPHIHTNPIEPGKGVEFTATFEVYPEIKLKDLSKLSVDKANCEIKDSDIDKMLENLQKQRGTWENVERASGDGDQLSIDFEGSIKGEVFEGGTAEKFTLVLGSEQMIPGFEDALIGLKAGDEKTFDVKFPKDYQKEELKGKKASFAVKVHEVAEQKLPELNDEFAKTVGVKDGTLDALKAELRDHMAREVEQAKTNYMKKQVMDGFLDLHKVDLPQVLVDQEIDAMMQQAAGSMQQDVKMDNLPRELFEENAKKRVSLGLILGEIVKENEIKADAKKVREKVDQYAANYQDPSEVVKHYYSNPQMIKNIEALVVEENVVEWALGQVKIVEKPMDFDELIKHNQS